MRGFKKPFKISKEIILLTAAALICLAYIGFRENGNINYKLPEFKALNKDDFTKIRIIRPEAPEIDVQKSDTGWILSNDSFPADETKINRLLDFLTKVEPVDLVSQSGNQSRYDLDEGTRVTVKAFRNDSLIREIYLGKLSGSENYTYVLFPGNKNIYTLRGTLKSLINLKPEEFRDKVVMKINRNDIIRVSYSGTGGTHYLNKGGDDAWTDESGTVWTADKIQDLLGRFASLTCSRFLTEPPSGEASTFTLTGTKDYTLTMYPKTEEGYPAVSSEHPQPFMLTGYTGDSLAAVFSAAEGN